MISTTVWANNACNGMEDVTADCYGWSSTDTGIATVDSYGNVTGVAPGCCTIQCKVDLEGLKPPACPVRVLNPNTQVNVTPTVSISGPQEVPLVASGTNGPHQVSLSSAVDPGGGTYSWSTPDTDKVGLSGVSGPTVTVTSVSKSTSRGDVTITLTHTYNNIPGSASAFMTVQQPTYLSIASNISSGPASCPAGQAGWDRRLWWQVEDQFTGTIQFGGMPFYDEFAWQGANGCSPPGNTNGCNITNFQTTPPNQHTGSNGQFNDHYFICTPCCYNGGHCTTTANQTYYVNGYGILKNPAYTCSGITINGQ